MIRLANAARTRRCNYERSWCPCGALWRSIRVTPISSSLIVITVLRHAPSCPLPDAWVCSLFGHAQLLHHKGVEQEAHRLAWPH